MVTHFNMATGEVACGRNNHDVTGSRDKGRVTCRNCRSTEVFKAHPDVEVHITAAVEQVTYNWRHAWAAAVQIVRPHDRLPRGFKCVVRSSPQ